MSVIYSSHDVATSHPLGSPAKAIGFDFDVVNLPFLVPRGEREVDNLSAHLPLAKKMKQFQNGFIQSRITEVGERY